MAVARRLPGTLQENLLTLLCHSDEHGKIIARLVEPALFEGDYRVIAERAVDYWGRYERAPRAHVPDMLSDILESKHDRRGATFRAIIVEMLRLSEDINPGYAVDRLRTFIRVQHFNSAVLESARKLQAQRELALPEVEEMWADLLRARDETFAPAFNLNETDRVLSYLRARGGEFTTGIEELDAGHIQPSRGGVLLFIASTGLGKTWFLVHMAKRAIMERKRVFYGSLELSEEELGVRFYQSLFGVPKREVREPIMSYVIEKDTYGRLASMEREEIAPDFTLSSPYIEDELEVRRREFESKFKLLQIKRFPTRGLTVNQLRGYLDTLESTSGFIPDVIILDYIGIMRTDAKDHRVSLGRTFEDFRGLCVERDAAGITAQQVSKEGARAKRAAQTNIAEDWSLIGTADICLSLSATSAEKRAGLARMFVEKGRAERDRFGLVISQNYTTGQFALGSAPLDARYDEFFDASADDDGGDSE